ncbi:MAG: GFA family protein [Pseudomonadota bacterium]
MSEKIGQCLCGAVKFKATPKNAEVGVCHCSICRRQSAGPFFAIDCGDSLVFEDATHVGAFASSDWAERGFCTRCGSTLFWRLKDKSINIVAVDLFDEPGDMVLDHEVFIDEKPGYYSFAEKTKQMTGQEVFEMFADGGEGQA